MPVYFEDYEIGSIERFGHYPVTREEVIEFAGRYDPQPFHLDDEAAAKNPVFGRVAASGWHTAAMAMRMLVDHWKEQDHLSMGSPGLDELRWLKPVYPGDTLSMEVEVVDKSAPRTRPMIGFVKFRTIVYNQRGEAVMRQISNVMQPRKTPGAPG